MKTELFIKLKKKNDLHYFCQKQKKKIKLGHYRKNGNAFSVYKEAGAFRVSRVLIF